MNPWSEPIGFALLAVAIGAAVLVVAGRNSPRRRRWVAIATAILVGLVFVLLALFAAAILSGIDD